MPALRWIGLLAGIALLSTQGACSSIKPLELNNVVDEIPPGPGLFSGEEGEFVIYRR